MTTVRLRHNKIELALHELRVAGPAGPCSTSTGWGSARRRRSPRTSTRGRGPSGRWT